MDEKTRVIVIHGYCMLREGLVTRLKEDPSIEVCGITSVLSEVPDMIRRDNPHLILTNVAPKCSTGSGSLKKLKKEFPWIKILAFSCSAEFEHVHSGLALSAGADGYMSSVDTLDDLVGAIHAIRQGRQYVSPRIKAHWRKIKASIPGFAALSRRETEVFCLTGCGYMTKHIAEMMNVKIKTIEGYKERIRKKLRLKEGPDLLFTAVSFMRSAARRGLDNGGNAQIITEWI